MPGSVGKLQRLFSQSIPRRSMLLFFHLRTRKVKRGRKRRCGSFCLRQGSSLPSSIRRDHFGTNVQSTERKSEGGGEKKDWKNLRRIIRSRHELIRKPVNSSPLVKPQETPLPREGKKGERLARGTTLCNVSRPLSGSGARRGRREKRRARVGPTMAMRTCPLHLTEGKHRGGKKKEGLFHHQVANFSSEPRKASGQWRKGTNIEADGAAEEISTPPCLMDVPTKEKEEGA